MKKSIWVIFMAIIGVGLILGEAPPMYAQEEFTLEEITVTAQKREENQQKVAIPMEVISSETIQELGRTDIEEILSDISNVIINKDTDGMRISIRGLSNDNPVSFGGIQGGATPTVAMNFDGVYTNRQDSGQSLFDLERVEVLMGPQSTLYSNNSPGGIVNIVTATPKLMETGASGTLEYGNYGLLRADGVLNAPLGDKIAIRTAFHMTTRDGYLDDGTDDEDTKSARLRFLLQPHESFSFLATGEYIRTENRGGRIVKFANQGDVANPWTSDQAEPPDPNLQNKNKFYADINWDVGFGTITMVPSYATRVFDDVSPDRMDPSVIRTSHVDFFEKGAEARIASNEGFLFKYLVGYSWYEAEDESRSTGTDGSFSWRSNSEDMTSIFGNVTYPVSDIFRLTGGVRYSESNYLSENTSFPNRMDPTDPNPSYTFASMSYSAPDYKIGIEYDALEQMMVYADLSTSYRIQGNAFQPDGTPFPAEEITAYTLGWKSRWFGNRLQLNYSAYYYDYQNYLAVTGCQTVSQIDFNEDGDFDDEYTDPNTGRSRNETTLSRDENAKETGDAEMYGFDVMASMIITDKDRLNISISNSTKRIVSLFMDYWDVTNNVVGIPDRDWSGYLMSNSPEWSINANYSHNFHLASGGVITARFDTKYQSDFQTDLETTYVTLNPATFEPILNDATGYIYQEAHHISNITAIYADPTGKWTLSAYIKNIGNYAEKRSFKSSAPFGMVIGPPRTYGAILTVRY
jgi:iron complex outermembrane receptor protein